MTLSLTAYDVLASRLNKQWNTCFEERRALRQKGFRVQSSSIEMDVPVGNVIELVE